MELACIDSIPYLKHFTPRLDSCGRPSVEVGFCKFDAILGRGNLGAKPEERAYHGIIYCGVDL